MDKEGILAFLKEIQSIIDQLQALKQTFIDGLINNYEDLKHQIFTINFES